MQMWPSPSADVAQPHADVRKPHAQMWFKPRGRSGGLRESAAALRRDATRLCERARRRGHHDRISNPTLAPMDDAGSVRIEQRIEPVRVLPNRLTYLMSRSEQTNIQGKGEACQKPRVHRLLAPPLDQS